LSELQDKFKVEFVNNKNAIIVNDSNKSEASLVFLTALLFVVLFKMIQAIERIIVEIILNLNL